MYTQYLRPDVLKQLPYRDQTSKEFHDCRREKERQNSYQIGKCTEECREPCKGERYHVHQSYEPPMPLNNTFSIKVVYKELVETVIGKQPRSDLKTLIANFGGTLGLMTGMSALSIIEIFIWLILSVIGLVINITVE